MDPLSKEKVTNQQAQSQPAESGSNSPIFWDIPTQLISFVARDSYTARIPFGPITLQTFSNIPLISLCLIKSRCFTQIGDQVGAPSYHPASAVDFEEKTWPLAAKGKDLALLTSCLQIQAFCLINRLRIWNRLCLINLDRFQYTLKPSLVSNLKQELSVPEILKIPKLLDTWQNSRLPKVPKDNIQIFSRRVWN